MARFLSSFVRRGPVHLNLQLLYDCNFRCRICDFWTESYRNLPRLTASQVETIAEKLKVLAPLIVSIGGGEPALHEELVEITRILSRDHFPVMICNGWHMTPGLARRLFAAGMYEVSVSVDYADAERHDRQRGVEGAFDRAVAALRILHENRVHRRQRVHMISVLMDDNLDDVEPLIRRARDMGITYLVTFYSHGRGTKERRLPEGSGFSRRLLELKDRYPEFVALPGYLERFDEAAETGIRPCYAGKNLFNIDCTGNVSRCIDRLDRPAGNILTDDTALLLDRLREQFEEGECGECWTSCRGSVESLMYGENRLGNLLAYYRLAKSVPLVRLPSADRGRP